MINTIEDLYQQIGQAVADSVTEEWNTACLEVDMKPGVVTMVGHYHSVDNSEHSFRPSRKLVVLFNKLHEVMIEEMKADWKSARLDLSREGKFNLDFNY